MLIKSFIRQFQLDLKTETDKVLYLAYFYMKHADLAAFNRDDAKGWFEASDGWAQPNISRLWGKLEIDRRFVRGQQPDTMKLKADQIELLEQECADFNFAEIYMKLKTRSGSFVDSTRLSELRNIKHNKFDLAKVLEICEELNRCIKSDCKLAIGMLIRALIDHVPPIFSCNNFQEVTNNYAGGKSFKAALAHLDKSSRKIADLIMHTQIRSKEALPTLRQVDFSNDVDVLLCEIVRILK